MNIRNAHINFKLFLDKIDSEAYPEISPEEIDVFLNESIQRFVKVRYGRNNIYKTGFETTQKRIDDLKEIVKTNKAGSIETSDYSLTGLNVYEVDLSTLTELDGSATSYKYQFHLKSRVHITKEDCDLWTSVTEITQDEFNRVEKDPFNKPEGKEVLIFFEGNNIYLWAAQNIIVDDFITTFIKQPKQVKLGTTVLGDSILGTNIISNVSDAQNMRIFVNDPISGPGIPKGTTIVAKGNEGSDINTITISNNAATTVLGATFDTSVEFELSNHTHDEIVQMAVTIALENLESRRVQTQPVLNENKIE